MSIIRFLIRSAAFFFGGMISFFLVLVALAALLCLLFVGLTCAMFTVWAAIHYAIYLSGHDTQAGHRALQAILMAAGCFGFIVLTFSTITDFYRRVTRPRPGTDVSLELGS
jgi:hypothetical protein